MLCGMCANLMQVLFVGGIFPQFRLDSKGNYVMDAGVRRMAAAQMAINRVNNKTDGVYDNLLPDTQVGCAQVVLVQHLQRFTVQCCCACV